MIGAFASMISHVEGHRDDIVVIHRQSIDETWDTDSVKWIGPNSKKVLVLELRESHFILTVVDILEKKTYELNGYTRKTRRSRSLNINLQGLFRSASNAVLGELAD